jgi:hypothetical protein
VLHQLSTVTWIYKDHISIHPWQCENGGYGTTYGRHHYLDCAIVVTDFTKMTRYSVSFVEQVTTVRPKLERHRAGPDGGSMTSVNLCFQARVPRVPAGQPLPGSGVHNPMLDRVLPCDAIQGVIVISPYDCFRDRQ